MNFIYGIEPDLCLRRVDLMVNFLGDLILPKYFYTQLNYLQNQNFEQVSNSARLILNSLNLLSISELTISQVNKEKFIYFIEEDIVKNDFIQELSYFDLSLPLDRYLLALNKLAEWLNCKVVFFTDKPDLLSKTNQLKFITKTKIDFNVQQQSWLNYQIILEFKRRLNPIQNNMNSLIQWQENITVESSIIWSDRS